VIDKEIFAQRMGLLAGRIGRELEGAVQAEYYRALSRMLTTEQFVAATALCFATWDSAYRNWPSPQQLVEMVTPVAEPSLSGAEMFERVFGIYNDPRLSIDQRKTQLQLLGATAVRAFHASGGRREFENVLEADVRWIRKTFVDAYESVTENAESERAANLALASASEAVRSLVDATAEKLAMPAARKIAAGGAR
jgi:hypothetical protein